MFLQEPLESVSYGSLSCNTLLVLWSPVGVVKRGWEGEAFYNLGIKSQFLVYLSPWVLTSKCVFVCSFFSPFMWDKKARRVFYWLSALPHIREGSSKIISPQKTGLCYRECAWFISNCCFSIPHAQKKWVFLWSPCENLMRLLEVKPRKVYGSIQEMLLP